MASPTPLSKANNTFSLALLKKFGDDDKTENIFYSPFSISSALAMVMLGARGNTATQMSECLKTKDCQDDVHVSFAQLLSELNKAGAPYALSVANRLYGEQSYQFVEDFLGKTKKHYNAELETVDFKAGSEAARLNINSWVQKQTQDTMASPTPLSKANTTFSLALLKKFGDDDKTANIFYSPFSISSALAMVMLGARGNTATQMSECLKTKDYQDDVHVSFAQLLSELNKADAPYALSVANRLYGEQSYQFDEDFLGKTKKYYNAELETVDFLAGSEAARLDINSWVQKQTQDKIKDLLAKGDVDSLSRLVLVNAMYFKSDWNRQFQQCDTQDAEFRLNKNDTKPVKMMYQETLFPFFNNPKANCKILEMPYKGKELSMLIFLPNEMEDSTTGLEKLEKQLTYENFMEWTRPDMMDNVEVQVGLPRFKMEESYDMEEVLVSMGMVDAFDEAKSDFSGMSSANDLVVSKVVHKAFVEVNEEGTEAAAATAAIMKLESCMISCPSATFIADHPFLFFIRHNSSMSILFAGRYCSPE